MQAYKNPGKLSFSAVVQDAGGGGAYVDVPFSVEEEFGVRGRVPIKAVFQKKVSYTGSIVKMGKECHMLLILKSIRESLKIKFGDTIHISIELDDSEREISLPDDIRAAFDKHKLAQRVFEKLSFTHQREYYQWVTSAKKPETRQRRIEKMLEMLTNNGDT